MILSQGFSLKRMFRRFKWALIGLIGLWIALCVWTVLSLFQFSKKDLEEYQTLMVSTQSIHSHEKVHPYTARQLHRGVHKQIIVNGHEDRLQMRLDGVEAELILEHKEGGSATLSENFKNVTGLMQEQLYYTLLDGRKVTKDTNGRWLVEQDKSFQWVDPSLKELMPMQYMRYFEAEEAHYHYNTQQLIAHQVKLLRYLVPGHQLVSSIQGLLPIMQASAHELSLSPKSQEISLSNHVVIEQEYGRLAADKVHLILSKDKADPFKYAEATGHVEWTAHDGAHLTCLQASFDGETGIGVFTGDERQPVLYKESAKEGRQLSLKSQGMHAYLSPRAKRDFQAISRIVAEGDVEIEGQRDLKVEADYAVYYLQGQEDQGQTILPGILYLCAKTPQGKCQIRHPLGDLIRSKEMTVDTLARMLILTSPQGVLFTKRQVKPAEAVHFSSGQLFWDEKAERLTLKDRVIIQHATMGRLDNAQEVHIQKNPNGHIETIRCQGPTDFTYSDAKCSQHHYLKAYGQTKVDHSRLVVTLDSPCDAKGQVAQEQQVFLKNALGQVYADRAEIKYELVNHTAIVKKIILQGHVRLVDNHVTLDSYGVPLERYGLADQVDYTPHTKEAVFSSKRGGRVLFYDRGRDLRMSAPALTIKRDPVTKHDSIKGWGDVRCSFVDAEMNQFKSHFLLEKPNVTSNKPEDKAL
jgi:lipopolysaccharide export system protein LptA